MPYHRMVTRYVSSSLIPCLYTNFWFLIPKAWLVFVPDPTNMVQPYPWSLKKTADPDPMVCNPWSQDCDPRSSPSDPWSHPFDSWPHTPLVCDSRSAWFVCAICICFFWRDLFSSCNVLITCDCWEIISWSDLIWEDRSADRSSTD